MKTDIFVVVFVVVPDNYSRTDYVPDYYMIFTMAKGE